MTTMREQVSLAMSGTTGHHGDVLDAVMAVVGSVERERDEARASVEHLRGDYRRIRKDRDRLLLAWRSAHRRANQFRWLHAEAVWQREQLRVEADHQWAVRRQMGHRMIDTDSELTEAVDLARWLLAEALWQQEVYRQAWARATVDASVVAVEHQKWADTIAETAVRLSDAGYHGQLVNSVARLIADRDAERESRLRWAEEAAELQAKVDLPCGSCHPCVNWDATAEPGDAEEALTAALEAHQSGIVTMDEAGPKFDAQYAAHIALDLIRSWGASTSNALSNAALPADWQQQIGLCESSGAAVDLVESWLGTVEAAPPHGPDAAPAVIPTFEMVAWCEIHAADARSCACPEGAYEERHRDCATADGVCIERHAGVSGTGTEAAPLADVPEAEWRQFHEDVTSARGGEAPDEQRCIEDRVDELEMMLNDAPVLPGIGRYSVERLQSLRHMVKHRLRYGDQPMAAGTGTEASDAQ